MTDTRAVHMHELRPGDVFDHPANGGAALFVLSNETLEGGRAVAILALQLQPAGDIAQAMVYADALDTGFVPVAYPTEAVDDMPSDWWPTDKED